MRDSNCCFAGRTEVAKVGGWVGLGWAETPYNKVCVLAGVGVKGAFVDHRLSWGRSPPALNPARNLPLSNFNVTIYRLVEFSIGGHFQYSESGCRASWSSTRGIYRCVVLSTNGLCPSMAVHERFKRQQRAWVANDSRQASKLLVTINLLVQSSISRRLYRPQQT